MLSRIISISLVRTFSTASTPAVRSTAGQNLIQRAAITEQELIQGSQSSELTELETVVQNERKHLAYYANE